MTASINEVFQQGLVLQAYQAERNILIWQYIGEEKSFLETQNKSIKDLYSFVQLSAQTNFILSLGKLFDNPSKRYPTLCILYFLDLLLANANEGVEIIETTNTIKLLKEFNCPEGLISAVTSSDKSLFPKLFATHYNSRYADTFFQSDLKALKLMRDKAEAHNESTLPLSFKFDIATRLLDFATELIAVFGMAYHSTVWKTDKFSLIKAGAKRNAYFVKSNIETLKRH